MRAVATATCLLGAAAGTWGTPVGAALDARAPAPVIEAGSVAVLEPEVGVRMLEIPVTSSEPVSQNVAVRWTVVPGPGSSLKDFVGTAGTISFTRGDVERLIYLDVVPQRTVPSSSCWFEADVACLTFDVQLDVLTGEASIAPSESADTILWPASTDPGIGIGDSFLALSDEGPPRTMYVPVTLSAPETHVVTVSYKLQGNSATPGIDYRRSDGVLRFPAGATTNSVPVTVWPRVGEQPDEVVQVNLSSPRGATLLQGSGFAIIGTEAEGIADPLSEIYSSATLTQVVSSKTGLGDTYAVTATASGTAMEGSARIAHPEDRMLFWPAHEHANADSEACATWATQTPSQEQGNLAQQGLALRVATHDGVTRAITVTKNVYGRNFQELNVHVWNTSWKTPFRLVAKIDLSAFLDAHGNPGLPWNVCARVVGGVVGVAFWLPGESPPPWGNSAQTATVTLPGGWDYEGVAAWYVGHLFAGTVVTYTHEYAGDPTGSP